MITPFEESGPAALPPAEGETDPDESFGDYLRVLWKHRWVFLLTLVLVVGGTAIVVTRMTPVYRATATLEISPPQRGLSVEDLLTTNPFQREYFQTMLRRIALREVLQPVFEDYHEPDQTFEEFAEDLEIEPQQDSNLVQLSLEGVDRARIVAAVNATVSSFLRSVTGDQAKASIHTRAILDTQAEELRKQMKDAREKLDRFMEQNGLLSSLENECDMLRDQLTEKTRQYESARNLRAVAEANHDEIVRGREKGLSPGSIPVIAGDETYRKLDQQLQAADQELADLSQSLGSTHPSWLAAKGRRDRIESQIEDRIRSLTEQAEREFSVREQVFAQVAADRKDLEGRLRDIDRRKFEYDRIQRDLDRYQQEYETYLKTSGQLDPVSEIAAGNVKVRELATTPEHPVKPRILLSLLLAGLAGIFFGALFAFGLETLDDSLKSRDEVAARLHLPVLGAVPMLKAGDEGVDRVAEEAPTSPAAEAFRTIRTALLYATPGQTCRSVLVTSAGPGEGKTLSAANLAVVFAQAGHRTLLVDADLRRPRVHRVFGIENRSGLTTALVQGGAAREYAVPAATAGLFVLPTGPIPPNPSEILGSARMHELLTGAAADFDRVVIDSPPTGAVTDAAVLAPHVDAVVQVVLAGVTSWRVADRGRRQILSVGGRHLGVLLNGDRVSRRGYDGYYYARRDGEKTPRSTREGKAARRGNGVPSGADREQ